MTGKEWREFMLTGWPDRYIWSDDPILDDGRDIAECDVDDGETFTVPADWTIYLEDVSPGEERTELPVRSLIRKWRKSRDTVTFAVTVPKECADKIKAMLRAQRIKV